MNYYQFNFYENNEFVSIIKIEIEKLIMIYDEEISYYKKYCKKLPKDAPRHTEYDSISKIRLELVDAIRNKENIDFENRVKYISTFSQKIIRKNEYDSIYCVKCQKKYFEEEINNENWSTGSGLIASGGKTLKCKENHFLFGWMQWNS